MIVIIFIIIRNLRKVIIYLEFLYSYFYIENLIVFIVVYIKYKKLFFLVFIKNYIFI